MLLDLHSSLNWKLFQKKILINCFVIFDLKLNQWFLLKKNNLILFINPRVPSLSLLSLLTFLALWESKIVTVKISNNFLMKCAIWAQCYQILLQFDLHRFNKSFKLSLINQILFLQLQLHKNNNLILKLVLRTLNNI